LRITVGRSVVRERDESPAEFVLVGCGKADEAR